MISLFSIRGSAMLNKAKLLSSLIVISFGFSLSTAAADTVCPPDPNHPPAGWMSFGHMTASSKKTVLPPQSKQCAPFAVAAVNMPAANGVFCYYTTNQILMSTDPAQATSQNWSITTCLKHPQVQGGRYTVCCDESISSCNFITDSGKQ